MKITFFGTQPYDRESFDRANASCGFEFNYHRSHLNGNNALLAQGADAVCIFVNDTADAGTIRQLAAMGVKLIALRCAGFNNVDLKAAAEYGIPVVRVPAYSPHAVAEHAVALMLALNRKVHRAYWRTRDGNFSLHGLMGFDMYGKTAGIVGTGKIARELIRILKGFGMKVLAYDIFPDAEYAAQAQVEYVTLDELYRRADIISLHCPLTDQTRYMINGHRQDETRRDPDQYGARPADPYRGADRGAEGEEDRGGRAGRLRGGGCLFLRGYLRPDHGRRYPGTPAVVQQRHHDLAPGFFHT